MNCTCQASLSLSLFKHRSFELMVAIQPSHPLLPPSPLALNFPQHQSFQWVDSASSGQSIGASTLASVLLVNPWLISFRIDWFNLLAVQRTVKSLHQCHSSKPSIHRCSVFFKVNVTGVNVYKVLEQCLHTMYYRSVCCFFFFLMTWSPLSFSI